MHLGDNGPLTEENYKSLRPVDVLMLPADELQHILKNDEIADIVAALEPRVIVPMHYRLPRLEAESDSPDDLGEIDPWLEGRDRVVRLESHRWQPVFADDSTIVVFNSSPLVASPEANE